MSIIVYMMLRKGVISLFFEDDIKIVLSRCKDWVNKFEKKPIIKILIENRLRKRKKLYIVDYQEKLIDQTGRISNQWTGKRPMRDS